MTPMFVPFLTPKFSQASGADRDIRAKWSAYINMGREIITYQEYVAYWNSKLDTE
jgi:hypothetical protein